MTSGNVSTGGKGPCLGDGFIRVIISKVGATWASGKSHALWVGIAHATSLPSSDIASQNSSCGCIHPASGRGEGHCLGAALLVKSRA
jgi:hypothetical protein